MTDEMKKAVSKAIARKYKLDKYAEMMDLYKNGEGISNENFQTLFNSYFDVRRDDKWKDGFYTIFDEIKGKYRLTDDINENLETYNNILTECNNRLKTTKGNDYPVEASFSSKMLAVINPDMPILDKQVLENMGNLKISGKDQKKLDSAKEIYEKICKRYDIFKDQYKNDYKSAIELFNTIFPDYTGFTDTKKIDWFLWALTSDELEEIGLFEGLIK